MTHRDNLFSTKTSTRLNFEKTHCGNGHELTPENTIFTSRAGDNANDANSSQWQIGTPEIERELVSSAARRTGRLIRLPLPKHVASEVILSMKRIPTSTSAGTEYVGHVNGRRCSNFGSGSALQRL